MNSPQQQRNVRVRWRLIGGHKTLRAEGFRRSGASRPILAVVQLQHEFTQKQHAGGRVLRLFRGSSGSWAAAVGHDPLYHWPGDVEKFHAAIMCALRPV